MCAWHPGHPVGTLSDTRVGTRTGPQGPIPDLGKGSCPFCHWSVEADGHRLPQFCAGSRSCLLSHYSWAGWDGGSSACSAKAGLLHGGYWCHPVPGGCLWETPSGHSLKVKLMVFLDSSKNTCAVFIEPYLM